MTQAGYKAVEKCLIEGCHRAGFARGLCGSHYARERSAGRLEQYPRINVIASGTCTVEGCDGRNFGRGMCKTHYRRAIAVGELPGAPMCTGATRAGAKCRRSATADGMCSYHRARLRIGPTARRHAPRSHDRKRPNSGGYILMWRPGHPASYGNGEVTEHKLLAYVAMGRTLLAHETVHHRDGNRANNTIGPCFLQATCECPERHNLELWSKSQPSGQRVADKVRWAQEILALYGPETATE